MKERKGGVDMELDDRVDRSVSRALAGRPPEDPYGKLAAELARVMLDESPRLAPAVQRRHLALLRARARRGKNPSRSPFILRFGGWLRLAQVAVAAIIFVLVGNGISAASANSLPGSPLYAVKRLGEHGSLLIAPSAADRARLWMNLADVRLKEAQELAANKQPVDAALLDSIEVSLMRALLETAGTRGAERVGLLKEITQLAARQESILEELAMGLGPEQRVEFEQTAHALNGMASLAGAPDGSEGEQDAPAAQGDPTVSATATATETVSVEDDAPTVAPTKTKAAFTPTPTLAPTLVPAPAVPATAEPEDQQPAPTSSPGDGSGSDEGARSGWSNLLPRLRDKGDH